MTTAYSNGHSLGGTTPTLPNPEPSYFETWQRGDARLGRPDTAPKVPTSADVTIVMHGQAVSLMLHDTDDLRLLARLERVLAQYPAAAPVEPGLPPQIPSKPGWCNIHSCAMSLKGKEGARWFSHLNDDGSWCKGVPKKG